MFFGFTDDQLAFRDGVRSLLVSECPPTAVRASWEAGPGYDGTLWAALGDMGVLGLLAPEADGGLGLDEVDLVLLLEESGRAALPGPLVEHAAVVVPLLAEAGRHDLCGSAAAGRIIATAATGTDRVGWAASADVAVILTGGGLVLAPPEAGAPLACVDRSRREAPVANGRGDALGVDVELACDRATLGTAAQLCGLAAHMIDTTVAYTTERRQFGVPIGSYQAVKHHLANALLLLEHARPPVYRAAWSVARRLPTRSRDVSMAKVMANRAAACAARAPWLQCHGAIGYTWESDLHLWMKRAWVLERAWGATAHHQARVADALLGPA